MPETQIIHDSRAAKILLDPDWSLILKVFMLQTCSLQEAAEKLKTPDHKLYYPVRRMHSLGLLEVAHESKRQGRAIKHYRSSATSYLVPFRLSPFASLEDFIAQGEIAWSRQLLKEQARAYLERHDLRDISLNVWLEDGLLMHELVPQSREHPSLGTAGSFSDVSHVIALWDTRFYLSEEDVQNLASEVLQVLERYQAKQSGSRRLLRFAIAPWKP